MTSKAASQEHGIGLNNVKQIVEKYHGEMHFETEDDTVPCRNPAIFIISFLFSTIKYAVFYNSNKKTLYSTIVKPLIHAIVFVARR